MRLYRILPGLVLSLLVGAPVGQVEAAAILTPGPARPALAFEPNQGQADPAVKFLARGRGFGLFLTQTETVLVVSPAAGAARRPGADGGEATGPSVVRMRLVGAAAAPTVTGVDPLPGRVHSLVGDPDRWRRDVPTFARVQYADVYPGISLVFYGREGQLEYDFVVAPDADPDAVVMAFDGAQNLKVDGDGDLVIATGAGDVRMRRPVIYQEIGQERRPIEGGYVLDGDRVRFRVAGHDPSHPLIIDPVLGYSSILNGSSDDQGFGIAVDSSGSVYVTGTTISSNFPVSPVPVQATRKGESDAFVTKLDATGLIIVYSTFLGGSGADAGTAIAVDGNGSAYIAGTTNSNNFPTTAASFQPTTRGGDEAFVARLGPDGSALVFSTYLGSNGRDSAFGLAINGAGNCLRHRLHDGSHLSEQQRHSVLRHQEHGRRRLRGAGRPRRADAQLLHVHRRCGGGRRQCDRARPERQHLGGRHDHVLRSPTTHRHRAAAVPGRGPGCLRRQAQSRRGARRPHLPRRRA